MNFCGNKQQVSYARLSAHAFGTYGAQCCRFCRNTEAGSIGHSRHPKPFEPTGVQVAWMCPHDAAHLKQTFKFNLFIQMKRLFVISIGALLLVALFGLALSQYLSIHPTTKQAVLIFAAIACFFFGTEMFPRNASKRPIVKRKLLYGTSIVLFIGAGLLLLNAFDCHPILALLSGHWASGGLCMAVAPYAFSEREMEEFTTALEGLKGYGKTLKELPGRLDSLERENAGLRAQINQVKKLGLAGSGGGSVRWVGNVPFVTDDCAKALTSVFVLECSKVSEDALKTLIADDGNRQRVLSIARETLGMQTRAALTTTDIPVPTVYAAQIVELVFKYGQARQYATVFPLGAGTVKLPRLKAGEDDFGYLGVGTAGMSQSVTERKVTAELVTFTANKAGGLIRIPYELEEDTFVPVGQFLARYIARQLAKLEDKTLFLGDGTSTYANQTGVGPYCAAGSNAYAVQLSAGKTKPSDATLADFRNMRAKVSAAVLAGGFDAAYYMNSTFEPFLRSFNTYPNFIVYDSTNPARPTFDGWPIRWLGVGQAYTTAAAAGTYISFFGALNYWYLGTRGEPRVEVSRDVFFATDELAMRALERIDVEAMAVDAMSALITAAS
jgi:HK97 family phage major capsid protein